MKKLVSSLLVFAPGLALAQNLNTNQGTLGGILNLIFQILNFLVPILIALGVVYFIYSVIKYITASDEDQKGKAKSMMIYAIIGLFIITTIWGLVRVLNDTLQINAGGSPTGTTSELPCINTPAPGPC